MTFLKPISALLILLATFLAAAPAGAEVRWSFASSGYQGWNDPRMTTEEKTVRIGRLVRNETLPLRKLLGLGQRFRGYTVERITVQIKNRARGRKARGTLGLITDKTTVDRKRAGHRRQVRLIPWNGGVIGRDFRTLGLNVQGRVRIETIRVTLTKPRNTPFGRGHAANCRSMERTIGRVITFNTFDLKEEFRLNRRRGCRIDRITVRARRTSGPAQVRLYVNGQPASGYQGIGAWGGEARFRPHRLAAASQRLQRLDLQFIGRVAVESVRIDFVPARPAMTAAYSWN